MHLVRRQHRLENVERRDGRQEALYRGYRIEGAKEGECMLLRVIPTKLGLLPVLKYSRFRTLPRGTWPKAVAVVCDSIDEAFRDLTFQPGQPRERYVRPPH